MPADVQGLMDVADQMQQPGQGMVICSGWRLVSAAGIRCSIPAVQFPSRPAIGVEVDVVPALVAGGIQGNPGSGGRLASCADHRKTRIVADVVRQVAASAGEQGDGIAERAWSSQRGWSGWRARGWRSPPGRGR